MSQRPTDPISPLPRLASPAVLTHSVCPPTRAPLAPVARVWHAGPLRLPREYWLLWLGMLINRLGGGVFAFLALYLTRARGLQPEAAGLVVGLYAAGGMIAGPVGGLAADRLGRRPTLVCGTAMAAATMLALGGARSVAAIVVLAPLLGFFTDLCRPPLNAAVADVVDPVDRTRAYGLLYWANNLGFAGAAAFAGVLAERSFTALFAIDAATTLIFGTLVYLGVPETRPHTPDLPRAGWSVLVPFRDRGFMTFALVQLPVLLVFQQGAVALPLDMRVHGVSTAGVGRLLALNGLVIITLQPLILRVAGHVRRARLLSMGAALTGCGFGVCAFATGGSGYALAVLVFTLGEIGFSVATPALLTDLAPVHHRGGYLGAFQLVWGLAGVAAPGLGSWVFGHAGGRTLWLGCVAAGLVSAALHGTLTARRALPREC